MNRQIIKYLMASILCVAYAGFSNACVEAEPPILPDPQTAVIAEMVKAQKEMKRYVKAQEDFLQCVNDISEHNAAVDRMKAMAAQFNSIIKEYKARVKT